jgi:inorganic triphosphatase YgiF
MEIKETALLNLKKQNLYRSLDRGDITKEDYEKQLVEIETEIKRYINDIILISKKDILEEEKMAKEKNVSEATPAVAPVVPKVTKVAKPKRVTITPLILKALEMKTVKSIEDVVAKVAEWDKSFTPEVIKKKTNSLLWHVKKGAQKRFQCYNWNEAEFLLTRK